MKVAILTIHSYNFGNRLQNYALQETLKKKNIQVDTLKREVDDRPLLKKIINHYSCYIKQDKISAFRRFDKKIRWSNKIVSSEYLSPNIDNIYDFVIAGSDQIWNPFFPFNSKLEFLPFIEKRKRVTYAASFGVSILPDEKKKVYKKYISDIPSISVREDQGKKIVLDLSGRSVSVVPDPTLLLTLDEWIKIEKKPKFHIENKYLLVYIIGEYTEERKRIIYELASEKKLKVIEILKDKGGLEKQIGPSEFIWLVHHSSCVCTDSYHGCLFTIIFLKERLYCVNREGKEKDMSSRFETLWNEFDLKSKRVCDNQILEFDLENKENLLKKHNELIRAGSEYLRASLKL